MRKEEFIAVSTKNEFLKKFIPYYYFYETFDDDFYNSFDYYPHFRCGLTVYKNSDVTWDADTRYINQIEGKNTVIFTKNIKTKHIAVDKGVINKICIAFEPLGINHFIDTQLCDLGTESLCYFDYFGSPFLDACEKVHSTADIDQKTAILDAFFLSKYQPFSETRMTVAVKILLNKDESMTIQKLSDLVGVNRKTLNRLFQKHLCCSPISFKKIIKFRSALNQHQATNSSKNLTDIAYDNHYYDQSEFINHCKKLTGLSPKSFFSEIQQRGSVDIYWSIKKPEAVPNDQLNYA